VESCVRRIFTDLFCFCYRWCGFRSVSSDLWLSLLVMVADLVRWSFGALARLSTTTSSITMNFAQGEDGGAPSARASVCSRR
jgi:hypothetical protein